MNCGGFNRPEMLFLVIDRDQASVKGWAVKAMVVDDENVQHLVIGPNRENIESSLRGEMFTLRSGQVPVLTENKSDIVLLFAETDEDSGKRFPPSLRPL